jgi:hypothetical protein
MACSSGDSLFSTSSGRNFATSGGASGQSSGDENDESRFRGVARKLKISHDF